MTWPLALLLGLGLPACAIGVALAWQSPVVFMVLHVISRHALDSAHQWTYTELIPGLSIVKLYSIGIAALLLVYLFSKYRLVMKPYGIMAFILIAAAGIGTVLNQSWAGFADVALKWAYVWLVALLSCYAMERSSPQRVAMLLLICLLYPLANLALAGVLIGPKFSAGQYSYIGTFAHEANVAYVLLAEIALAAGLVATARSLPSRAVLLALVVVGHVALYMNNYRTAFLGLLMYWIVMAVYVMPRLSATARIYLVVMGGIVFGAVAVRIGPDLAVRLSDLGVLLKEPGEHFNFSSPPRPDHLLSGRVFLINTYMYHFMQAPIEVKIAGIGPEGGNEITGGMYAHNEFVGALLEQGILGLSALLGAIVFVTARVRKAVKNGDWLARSLAALLAAICVMSLGTMPFRDSRALLYLGFALGAIEWYRGKSGRTAAAIPP